MAETNNMNVEKLPFPLIRALVETYYDFQSQRIMTASRIQNNVERNQIPESILEQFNVNSLLKDAKQFEKSIQAILEPEIKKYSIASWFSQLYGIGPILSAGMLAYIADPKRFEKISDLWQYCGYGMNRYCEKCKEPTSKEIQFANKEGKQTKGKRLTPLDICPNCGSKTISMIQKRQAGYLSNWNDKTKVLCWKIGQSFEKQGVKSSYYNFYKNIKEQERIKHPEKIKNNAKTLYNDGHIRNMALRKTIKLFLAHLWVTWRTIEGLPITDPYVGQILNHNVIKPFIDNKKSK